MIWDYFKHKLRKKELGPVGTYNVRVVSIPEELDFPETLPLEIRFVIGKNPEFKNKIKKILRVSFGGKAIGIRTVVETPQKILEAINHISIYSQHFTILTWLPDLLKKDVLPKFNEKDLSKARAGGIDLSGAARYILAHKNEFKKFVIIDEANEGIVKEEREFIDLLNKEIFDLSVDWIVHRVIADNAHERTKVAQTIIKTLIFIGPITHILEIYARGIGKVFAASTDDVLSEVAELFALRGSGFSWRTLAKRGRILIPVFILATYLAFNVEHFIEQDKYALAGILFGLSAVMLSLTTAIQSIFMYFEAVKKLDIEKKIKVISSWQKFVLAFKQDFTNPARLGLGIGALVSPFAAMIIFIIFPYLTHNGWVLALLGSTESFVAALTVIAAKFINQKRFEIKLKKSLSRQCRLTK